MPTVIDSLVVQLGLDSSKFTAGQHQALADFKKTFDGVQKTGTQIEDSAKRAEASLSALRTEVLALGAALLGGAGVKDFLIGLASAAQQLGFVSAATGTSVEQLSEWRNAARLAGGSAEGITSLIQHLSGELHTLRVTGNSAVVQWLRPMGIGAFEANGQIKETGKLIEEVLDALDRGRADKGDAAVFFRGLGVDQDTLNFLLQGKKAVEGYRKEALQLGVATKENAKNAREAAHAWERIVLAVENLGNKLLALLPVIEIFEKISEKFTHDPTKEELTAPYKTGYDRERWIGQFLRFAGEHGFITPGSALDKMSAGGGIGGTKAADVPSGLAALISSIKNEFPGVRITSTTGGQHAGAAHGEGRAVDFTTSGDADAVVARLRRELGESATVIDATKKADSKFWTGPHIHVQFKSIEAAAQYRAHAGEGVAPVSQAKGNSVEIGAINIYPPSGDPGVIAGGIGGALRNTDMVNQANAGQSK